MSVITSMLHSESTRRPTAQDLLDNKTLQIRGQDYQLRYSFALAKQKNDTFLKEIREIDQKSKELTKTISSLKTDPSIVVNLDKQINEIQKRFEQIKFKKSIPSKRPNSTTNQ
jgi:predicted  nucleic acid-binding Zn-ribbon protein